MFSGNTVVQSVSFGATQSSFTNQINNNNSNIYACTNETQSIANLQDLILVSRGQTLSMQALIDLRL